MNVMKKKGQGTFEYVLLLAGVLLIVILAIVLLRQGPLGGADINIKRSTCKNALASASQCYYATNSTWNGWGTVPLGSIPDCAPVASTVPACDNSVPAGTNASSTAFCCGAHP